MKKYNLKESLIQMDLDTDFKYTLTDLYEACQLSEDKKKELVQYIDARDPVGMNAMLCNEAGVIKENVSDDIPDDEMPADITVEGWSPDLTDCPECGDLSFDSNKGRCTKCSYRESLEEAFQEGDMVYVKPSKKSGRVVSVRGDIVEVEIMGGNDPDRRDNFYTSDLELEQSFHEGTLNEGPLAMLGDLAGKGVGDAWKGVKNFAKGVKDTAKDVKKTAIEVRDGIKQSKDAAKVRDAWRAMKSSDTVDQFKADYQRRQDARSKSDTKRDKVYKGKIGKSIGDKQDWKFVVNGKKLSYDQFMAIPQAQRHQLVAQKKVKVLDLMGRETSFKDHNKRLKEYFLLENFELEPDYSIYNLTDDQIEQVKFIENNLDTPAGYKAYYELEKEITDEGGCMDIFYDLSADFAWDNRLSVALTRLALADNRPDLADPEYLPGGAYAEYMNDPKYANVLLEDVNKPDLESTLRIAAESKMREMDYDDDFINEYFGIKLEDTDDNRIKVTVWGELYYEELDELADVLNHIVAEEDPDAYFDHETTGRIVAYIRKDQSEDIPDEALVSEWSEKFNNCSTWEQLKDVYGEFYNIRDDLNNGTHRALYDIIDKKIDELKPVEEALTESNAVATRPSISYVLSKNMDKLTDCTSPNEFREIIMKLVTDSDVDPKEIQKLQRALYSKKSISALWSTIGTYITGIKVSDGDNWKDTKNESTVNRYSLKEPLTEKIDVWEIEYNDGALQRREVPNESVTVKGTWMDVLNELDAMYVDIPGERDEDDMPTCSLEQFISEYEGFADFGGSNVVLNIKNNGKIVYQISDYDNFCDDSCEESLNEDAEEAPAAIYSMLDAADKYVDNDEYPEGASEEEIIKIAEANPDCMKVTKWVDGMEGPDEVVWERPVDIWFVSQYEGGAEYEHAEGGYYYETLTHVDKETFKSKEAARKRLAELADEARSEGEDVVAQTDDFFRIKTGRYIGDCEEYHVEAKEGAHFSGKKVYEDLNEDVFNKLDTPEDKPYSAAEIEKEIKSLTQNFTRKKDNLKCGFKEENDAAVKLLKKHYKNVNSEKRGQWFEITFSEPIKGLKESDERLNNYKVTFYMDSLDDNVMSGPSTTKIIRASSEEEAKKKLMDSSTDKYYIPTVTKVELVESVETSKEWEHKGKDGKIGRIRQSDGKGGRKPLTRDQAKEIAKFRGHEDDELYPVKEGCGAVLKEDSLDDVLLSNSDRDSMRELAARLRSHINSNKKSKYNDSVEVQYNNNHANYQEIVIIDKEMFDDPYLKITQQIEGFRTPITVQVMHPMAHELYTIKRVDSFKELISFLYRESKKDNDELHWFENFNFTDTTGKFIVEAHGYDAFDNPVRVKSWNNNFVTNRKIVWEYVSDEANCDIEELEEVGLYDPDTDTLTIPKGTKLNYEGIDNSYIQRACYSMPDYNDAKIYINFDYWRYEFSSYVTAPMSDEDRRKRQATIDANKALKQKKAESGKLTLTELKRKITTIIESSGKVSLRDCTTASVKKNHILVRLYQWFPKEKSQNSVSNTPELQEELKKLLIESGIPVINLFGRSYDSEFFVWIDKSILYTPEGIEESLTEAMIYTDTNGFLGEPGETYTMSQFRRMWQDKDTDPVMSGYDSFEEWVGETISQMDAHEEEPEVAPSGRGKLSTAIFIDKSGIMGEAGAKYTVNDLADYWEANRGSDPVLANYNGDWKKWLDDTIEQMEVSYDSSLFEESLTEIVKYPNGMEVRNDSVDMDKALDYMFGTDRDPNNDSFTEDEKQRAVDYWIKKTDPMRESSEGHKTFADMVNDPEVQRRNAEYADRMKAKYDKENKLAKEAKTWPDDKELTYEEAVALAKAYYNQGGDMFYETTEEYQFDDEVRMFGPMTVGQMKRDFGLYDSVRKDRMAEGVQLTEAETSDDFTLSVYNNDELLKDNIWSVSDALEFIHDNGGNTIKVTDHEGDRIIWKDGKAVGYGFIAMDYAEDGSTIYAKDGENVETHKTPKPFNAFEWMYGKGDDEL